MEDIYSIYEETLTAIGDALRRRFGDTKMETVQGYLPLKAISKTSNVVDLENWTEGYPNSSRAYDVVSIPGATNIEVNLYYETEGISWDYVQVASGALNNTNFPHTDATKHGGNASNIPYYNTTLLFKNTDTITFYFQTDGSGNKFLGYYAECIGYDADGNVILSEELGEWEEEVPNVYGPLEMPQAIDDIPVGLIPPAEALHLTGNKTNLFAGGTWDWFIESMGDQITTEDIYGETIFKGSQVKRIPFVLDKSRNYDTNSQWFYQCTKLEELPDITGALGNSYMFCYDCNRVRRVPDSWVNLDFVDFNKKTDWTYSRCSNMFQRCFSLRYIPEGFLKKIWCKYGSGGFVHNEMFYYCTSLDEIVGFRGNDATITSDQFYNTFRYCSRLKRLVFDMDNGQPRVQNWKSQTIDLSYLTGHTDSSNKNYILNYNSGITAVQEVKSDTTYQALKNDPDWFTADSNYSRYNRISAVETINSLPDCSAYIAANGGTNTIKFKGSAGSKTDGGAINTMTAEEIAVAAAKGWTVSLV